MCKQKRPPARAVPLSRHANGYEMMLLKIEEDSRRLKRVQSQEKKQKLSAKFSPITPRGWPECCKPEWVRKMT